ncbi:flavin reductase family protein [Micromonospora echinofusca]|uniref:Flavin reductase n=1 Tax=Micromonospora echinofusca TaxID=47858 RepID=A0ABS3VWJ9_MICEH|nr:flavin reductase family protein [Micromonospora echinofusca]MBO4208915.1 flavin reductase [Micromonospora echinofusca]
MTTVEIEAPVGQPVDDQLFRNWFRRQASSVVVVTVAGDPPAGFTATSFTSLSLHPPLVSVCLNRDSSSWPAMVRAGHVGVHLLGADQAAVAGTFATHGIDRFAAHRDWRYGPRGVPLLDGALGWLLCRVTQLVPAGDHAIVIAAPLLGSHEPDGQPLLYHDGHYTRPAH